MHKKKLVITIIVIALIAAIVICLIPFPKKISVTMHGVEMSANGSVLGNREIVVNVVKYRYLLKEDAYHYVGIEFNGNTYDSSSLTQDTIIHTPVTEDDPFDYMTISTYYPPQNRFIFMNLALDPDCQWAAFSIIFGDDNTRYYAASVAEDFDPLTIWELCQGIIFPRAD